MAQITLGGNPTNTAGSLPEAGTKAPGFTVTKGDFTDMSLADLAGQNVILNIFPSVDTPTCATSVRTFNERSADLTNTTVLCVSADLPPALGRFCGAEGIDKVVAASTFRSPDFAAGYGTALVDGKLAGLHARAIVVVNPDGDVVYSELVPEIAQEPDYDAALNALG